jgi:hypothetical protein
MVLEDRPGQAADHPALPLRAVRDDYCPDWRCPGRCQDGNSTAVRTCRGPAPSRTGRGGAGPAEPAGAIGPQPDLGRLLGRLEQHRVAVDVDHPAHLQAGRGDGFGLGQGSRRGGQQAAGVLAVGGPRQPSVRGPRRHAGDDLQPARVGVLVHDLGPAGAGVDGQQPHPALVPALHQYQRVVLAGPVRRHQVGNASPPVSTSTVLPSSLASTTDTSAFGVPAAG